MFCVSQKGTTECINFMALVLRGLGREGLVVFANTTKGRWQRRLEPPHKQLYLALKRCLWCQESFGRAISRGP